MPLIKSASNKARQQNIKEMISSGHDPRQAVAASYANQRRYRDVGGGNIPFPEQKPTYLSPKMFPPLSPMQVAQALPKAGYTPQKNFHGAVSGFMPRSLQAMPSHPPVPQYRGGRNNYAGGGAPVASSYIPPLTASQATAYPTLPPVNSGITQPSVTPQPYSSTVSNIPLSTLATGQGSNGVVAPVSTQGIPRGTPGFPTTTAQSALTLPPTANAATAATPATQMVSGNAGNSPFSASVPQSGSFSATGPNNTVITFGPQNPNNPSISGVGFGNVPVTIANPYYTPPTTAAANGGKIPQFAQGGMPQISQMSPWWTRRESESFHPGGLFHGAAPGRADTIPTSVASDSHVLSADVVSALGEGNNLAGANVLNRVFQTGPYGIPLSHGHASLHVSNAPVFHQSAGGAKRANGHKTVPIAASSGEFLVPPHAVYRVGMTAAKNMKLDPHKLTPRKVMDIGHDVIDKFSLAVRAKHIKTLQRLPPPRKD